MRRPAKTREQKKHDKEQRALLTLRRAAVRYSVLGDNQDAEHVQLALAFADLTTACDRYTETLTKREARKLAGKQLAITRETFERAIDDLASAHRKDGAP